MFLILQVTSANAVNLGAAARMVFSQQGGTIGRRAGNDWVLADPHVSGRHARIRAMGGTFFLEDNDSGNGVLVNGNRVHPGEPFPLKEGDVLFIDPFDISVRLSPVMPGPQTEAVPAGGWPGMGTPAAQIPTPIPAGPVAPIGSLDDLIGAGSMASPDEYNALLDTPPVSKSGVIPTGVDLLAKPVLHDAMTIATPPQVAMPRIPTPPPTSGGSGIPTNWDLSDLDLSPPPVPQAPLPPVTVTPPPVIPISVTVVTPPPSMGSASPSVAQPVMQPPPVMQQPVMQPPPVAPSVPAATRVPASQPLAPAATGSGGADFRAMLRGAGLDVETVDPQIVAQLGQVLRIVVDGLMEVLRARGEIKGEFRLQQTTFKPRENNPLKFSANVEDALHNLLVKRNAAYLDTPAAFEDAFVDVRHHQVAMLAGMRAAFDFMLTRFDPEALARQFDARPGRKLSIGLGAGGRHWDSFGEYYKEMTRDADDCFRRLFGDQFARAYEEQLQRLRAESRRLK
jgi:type VI secretion system FHA domain protein